MALKNDISRGLLLILIITVAGAFIGGYALAIFLHSDGIADGYVPTITMAYQRTGDDSCTFTVMGVTENDLLWSLIETRLNPSNATIIKPTTYYVVVGDIVTLSGLGNNTLYLFSMDYASSSASSYIFTWIQ
jgi:hypothetical protein